jgi:hypothetical protein
MSGATQPCPADAVVYVYGVTRADALTASTAPLVEGIVPRVPVELLAVGKLAVVMSRGPREAFAPADADAPADATWATERALAHHRVLASLAPLCAVAPVKFGALCRDMNDVLSLFARSEGAFERVLNRIAGAQEWGVKLFADADACRAPAGEAEAVTALKAEIAAASPGKAFFLAKKLRAAIDGDLRARLHRRVESVHGQLAVNAREAAANPVRQTDAAPWLVLDAAYLVETGHAHAFHSTVSALSDTLAAEGFELKLTGPWPPYSFAAIDTGGEADG